MATKKKNKSAEGKHVQRATKRGKRKRRPSYRLQTEHIDFICQEVAEWRGIKTRVLVDACIAQFPNYPPGSTYDLWWAKHICDHFPRDKWGNPTEGCKYRDRILQYRKEYLKSLKETEPLAHARERVKVYRRILDLALEERIARYQTVRKSVKHPDTGKIISLFEQLPIYERELGAAHKALEAIRVEAGDHVPDINSGETDPAREMAKDLYGDIDETETAD